MIALTHTSTHIFTNVAPTLCFICACCSRIHTLALVLTLTTILTLTHTHTCDTSSLEYMHLLQRDTPTRNPSLWFVCIVAAE